MNNEFQRNDNSNRNKVKIVIITILVMIVLGLAAFLVCDKVISKDNDITNNENNSNNNSELVNLDINSKEIKEIISPIQFGKWSESVRTSPHTCYDEVLIDEFLQGKFSEENMSVDKIIYFASIFVNTKVCRDDKTSECKKIYDSFRNDKDLIDYEDIIYFEYFEIEDLKNKVKEIFGPDIANAIKDEDYRKYNSYLPNNWLLSVDEPKYYIKEFNVNHYCNQSIIQLDEANQKGDEIYTYWNIAEYNIGSSNGDIQNMFYTTYFKENGIIKEYDYECYLKEDAELFKEHVNICNYLDDNFDHFAALRSIRSIGKATRYKITYKKQSDGKYYIHSGEWE